MAAQRAPDRLHFTGQPDADALLANDPMALLIGFLLDQQVSVQKAFSGPLELQRRLGTLDPARLAALDPQQLDAAFRERPALHRFPSDMARKTRSLCETIAERYGGDASRVWSDAGDAQELRRRLLELPGMGAMKVDGLMAVLGKRFGVRPPGWDEVAPAYPTLGDVDSDEALATYQASKRAYKASQRDLAPRPATRARDPGP